MAVYSKLLLSAGGGIVSTTQQAEQVKNTATVLIGLGGTGIDALRTIKTQVYSRLKADNPDAAVPRYQHIRFLGVDTTVESSDDRDEETPYNPTKGPLRKLDNTEIFSIYNPNIWHMFSNPEAIGKYDHTKVEASQGNARGFFRILPHDRHEDIRFSTENRYRVMPEEITGLYPGQAIVFDASTDQIIYFN